MQKKKKNTDSFANVIIFSWESGFKPCALITTLGQGCRGPGAGSPHAPGAHVAVGAPAPPGVARTWLCCRAAGFCWRMEQETQGAAGEGAGTRMGTPRAPYGPCALPQQLSPSVTLGAQSPGADGREMGESGKICFVSTPRLKGRGVPMRAP